jgi:hypothetical protein
LFLHRASIGNNFISENGIVAVFGDEDQLVKGDIRKINRPLSFERGIWINSRAMTSTAGRWLFEGTSLSMNDPFSETNP